MRDRPSVPLHMDLVACSDGRVGLGGFAVAMADYVGGGVVGRGYKAVVYCAVGPDHGIGTVGASPRGIVAMVVDVVDYQVGDVGMRSY